MCRINHIDPNILTTLTTFGTRATLAQLRGADLLEAHAFGEFLMPLPEHEAKGGQRRGDTEEGHEKKKAEQDEIEESPCHSKPFDPQNRRTCEWMSFGPQAFLRDLMRFVKKADAGLSVGMGTCFNGRAREDSFTIGLMPPCGARAARELCATRPTAIT